VRHGRAGRWRAARAGPGRRALAAAADQALSSGTNVVTLLVAARTLAPAEFGAIVVALGVGMVAVTAQRALVGDTLLACGSAVPDEARRPMTRDALATATAMGRWAPPSASPPGRCRTR